MNAEALQAIALAVAAERSVDRVLRQIVEGLVAQSGVALARVWLVAPGDICTACPLRGECRDRTQCLHLSASAGAPLESGERRSRLDGAFRRFPMNRRKIGRIGATGNGILVENVSHDHEWIANADWARRERIRSFGGQPLVYGDEVLGVLGVFSREPGDRYTFAWLRTFADHAAIAIAQARALAGSSNCASGSNSKTLIAREMRNDAPAGIIGAVLPSGRCSTQMSMVAPTAATVLIAGESGTGKELVARRSTIGATGTPSIDPVNCASIPRDLFESEFFGHVKGSFTGALRDRAGRFLAADGGTLFLDEVGEIPLDLQGKLLRVLQEGRFDASATRRLARSTCDVAATNRNLERRLRQAAFEATCSTG